MQRYIESLCITSFKVVDYVQLNVLFYYWLWRLSLELLFQKVVFDVKLTLSLRLCEWRFRCFIKIIYNIADHFCIKLENLML